MRIQQKFRLNTLEAEALPAQLKKLDGSFVRSVLSRDFIFTPDSRAFLPRFIDRYALTGKDRGLFLRVREENDLTSRSGLQSIHLFAYKADRHFFIDDQIVLNLDTATNQNRDLVQLLEMLGIDKVVEVTKKREEYRLVCEETVFQLKLDTVEHLPLPFLEIHAFTEKAESDKTFSAFEALKERLAIDPAAVVVKTYFQQLLQTGSETQG